MSQTLKTLIEIINELPITQDPTTLYAHAQALALSELVSLIENTLSDQKTHEEKLKTQLPEKTLIEQVTDSLETATIGAYMEMYKFQSQRILSGLEKGDDLDVVRNRLTQLKSQIIRYLREIEDDKPDMPKV